RSRIQLRLRSRAERDLRGAARGRARACGTFRSTRPRPPAQGQAPPRRSSRVVRRPERLHQEGSRRCHQGARRVAAPAPTLPRAPARARANLLTSLALVFPALLIYELGVLLLGLRQRNGVDLITDEIGAHIGYLQFGVLLVVVFFVLILHLRRTQRFEWSALLPVLLESGVYAVPLGTLILFVLGHLLGLDPPTR